MTAAGSRGRASAAISDGIVQLQTRYYGKGPTVETHIVDELVFSLLWGSFAKLEESLVALGHDARVVESRRLVHEAMQAELIAVVEGATSREVIAHLNQVYPALNLCAEFFILVPEGKM